MNSGDLLQWLWEATLAVSAAIALVLLLRQRGRLTAHQLAAELEVSTRTVLRDIDGPDVDAIVQVGTNLSMLRLADEAEHWLGKPVIAINAATTWHCLRAGGISDRIGGYGSLLREF